VGKKQEKTRGGERAVQFFLTIFLNRGVAGGEKGFARKKKRYSKGKVAVRKNPVERHRFYPDRIADAKERKEVDDSQ